MASFDLTKGSMPGVCEHWNAIYGSIKFGVFHY